MKLYRINALLLKYLYITKNSLDRVFDIAYWPILDIILWGFATAFIKDLSGVNLLSMIFGAIILWVFVWRSSVDMTVFILEDFWARNLYNLFTTPIRTSELVASIVIFAFQRSLISFVLQSTLAFLLYRFVIFDINLYAIALFAGILLMFGWAMGTFVTSFIFRFGQRIQVFAWSVVWILQPFSCVFYPLSALPIWAQKIASLMPATHVFEALRAVISGTAVNWSGIAYAIVVSILALIAGAYFLNSSIKHAKKTGLLARDE